MVQEEQQKKSTASEKKLVLILCLSFAFLGSLLLNSSDIYANYQAVSADGSQYPLWGSMFLVFPILFIVFILSPASLIGLIFRFSRKICCVILLCCIIYLGIAQTCFWISQRVRMAAFYQLAQRSEPLVQAIKNYQLQHGVPPASLEKLVPDFLPIIPKTGMGAYPEYEYKVGDEAKRFVQDTWCLMVSTPLGGLNWDIFVYCPNQNYSPCEDDGGLEKIKDWVYVHE